MPPAGGNSYIQSNTGTTYGKTVTYECNYGYTTTASKKRKCQSNGLWNGTTGPDCKRMSTN